ncbi:hypothetical protein F5B20DRAFT_548651 [Whalleya microplaca]|nr:hypothetical protein F5B20DRAFT_548651 [Whalleya microplaca]
MSQPMKTEGESSNHAHRHSRLPSSEQPNQQRALPPPPMGKGQDERHRMAEQAYKTTFASHERAVFQEEVRARIRRREVARNASFIRTAWHERPECWALVIGIIGLLWPILNQYISSKLFPPP